MVVNTSTMATVVMMDSKDAFLYCSNFTGKKIIRAMVQNLISNWPLEKATRDFWGFRY